MSEKIHPLKTTSNNEMFAQVLLELQDLRGEVAEMRASHTAQAANLTAEMRASHTAQAANLTAEMRASQTAQTANLTTQLQSQAVLIQQLSNQQQQSTTNTRSLRRASFAMEGSATSLANELYDIRSSNHQSNFVHVDRIFKEHSVFLEPLMTVCPHIKIVLSHVLTNNFGWSVKNVAYVSPMSNFTEEDCQRIATALAFFLRKRKTAEVALEVSERNGRNCNNHSIHKTNPLNYFGSARRRRGSSTTPN